MKAFFALALIAVLSVSDAFTGTSPVGLAKKTTTELNAIGLHPDGVGGVDRYSTSNYFNYRRPQYNSYGGDYDYDYGGIRRGGYGGYGRGYGRGYGGYGSGMGNNFHNARQNFVFAQSGMNDYQGVSATDYF